MAAKQIAYDMEAREAIRRGVKQLARAVKATLGPCGRNVMIGRSYGSPNVTKDGVTVAREIELEDPYENMGAQMVREVASKTSSVSGDGTTTATVYAEAIYEEGLKNVTAGAEAMRLKRGIEKAVATVVDQIRMMSTIVKDASQIAQVGTCAANQNEEIGKQIADAMDKVGKDGVITVEEGKTLETTVDLVEGMQFDRGYLSSHFINKPEDLSCEFENPLILIHEKKINNIQKFVPLLEKVVESKRPLLIIAEDVANDVLAALVINRMQGKIQVCAVKAPGFGDRKKAILEDLAVLTGAMAVFEETGVTLENLTLGDLGVAKNVRIDKDACTVIEGAGSDKDIKARTQRIRNEIDNSTSDFDKEKLEERLAKISGGVARINIGAATEVEMKEKKALVEDALHACRAAVEEGVLPGGGVAVLGAIASLDYLSKKLKGDEKTGVDIVRRALSAPIKQIASNAGQDGPTVSYIVSKNGSPNFGFNALTGEYGDMIEMGVLVPAKVERVALQNAASVASLLLTTNCVISEIKEPKQVMTPGGMPGGMPGMM